MAISQYKKIASTNRLFTGIAVFIVIILLVSSTKARRSGKGPVELTIYPAKAGELEKKYQLMVKADAQDRIRGALGCVVAAHHRRIRTAIAGDRSPKSSSR